MADDDLRDDGTIICPIHGMRYDPALTDGCIRCPRSSAAPGKRSAAPPRSTAPKSSAPPASVRAPSGRGSSGLPPRPTAPPIPFEPAYLGTTPYTQSQQGGAPQITILAGPKQRASRRGLVIFLGLIFAGGTGTAAWLLAPEGPTDWSKKITTFHYGPNASLVGLLFVPSAAAERACPVLILLGSTKNVTRLLPRWVRHCEEHGWIVATTNAFGSTPSADDDAAAALFIEAVRANANTEAGRVVVGGFDSGGEAACRLALVNPKVFSGAIMECCGVGAWRDAGVMASNDVAFFLFTRQNDTAREAMIMMKDEMQQKGLHVTFEQIDGGHDPMERDELDPAFAWLDMRRG